MVVSPPPQINGRELICRRSVPIGRNVATDMSSAGVEVFRGSSVACFEYGLVLDAKGLGYERLEIDGVCVLTVAPAVAGVAARLGAGPWRRFRYIRWPLLRRHTVLICVVTTLTGLQTFNQIFVLTNGGPNGATTTALFYIFNQGFVQFNTGLADAMGVILFGISLFITVVLVGYFGRGARRSV